MHATFESILDMASTHDIISIVHSIHMSSILIITKYEEIYPPLLKDFIYIT